MEPIINSTLTTFTNSSLFATLVAFIVKIYIKSDFEKLKIISMIISVVLTIYVSLSIYKIDTEIKLKNRIIMIESSTMKQSKKTYYINQAKDEIKELSELNVDSLIFSIGTLLLIGILFFLAQDTYYYRKHNKTLEKNK